MAARGAAAERGLFITIEGGDGAGKTTLARRLADCLQASDRPVLLTSEPGGTPLGRRLRSLLLDPEVSLSDWDEAWLFLAARASHVEQTILPALAAGQIVICDRYTDSTLAYQGFGRGLDLDRLARLCAEASGGLDADLTLLLDLPAEVGLMRARARSAEADRIGDEALAFHRRVNAGFRELAGLAPERITLVDASQAEDEVFAEAQRIAAARVSALLEAVGRQE